ncbi:hypothetical protein [Pseudoroseicyclus tamaricis]|uniref:Uncharacterized protein n=1 Tax=Pseudoroseicyclus tamaricis TaxID=2705421 RepID=A0A6B2JU89_9RHOB|nr:hypothetical protein [Pseudoroseicyclus tamaricis]NDV01868.1 hypothetical protein [Pseudoroseicyclus tamaricis]
MAGKSLVGGLYAFHFGSHMGFGLCTHEVTDGWGPRLGQLMRLFRGVAENVPEDVPAILSQPLLTSVFVDLPRMVRAGEATKLADVPVPPELAAPPRFRAGGPAPEHFFLVEGLGESERILEGSASEADIAGAPDQAVAGFGALERIFRFDLTPERDFAFFTGAAVLDEERDAIF